MPYKNYSDKLASVTRWNKIRDIALRKYIWNYKLGHPCATCGEADPIVLEFDHRDRKQKLFAISRMRFRTIEKLKAEIAKCDVRCANCHRRRTFIQRGYTAFGGQ